jgi:hypothetical protein
LGGRCGAISEGKLRLVGGGGGLSGCVFGERGVESWLLFGDAAAVHSYDYILRVVQS